MNADVSSWAPNDSAVTSVVIWNPNQISENRNREGEFSQESLPFRFWSYPHAGNRISDERERFPSACDLLVFTMVRAAGIYKAITSCLKRLPLSCPPELTLSLLDLRRAATCHLSFTPFLGGKGCA